MDDDLRERDRAHRLLQCLSLPEDAPRLLSDSRFWTPDVCAVYLDRCDDQLFDDPSAGLPMARLAPTLIHLLRPSARRDGLLVRALTVLGGALRATGSLSEADGAYRTAFAIACRASISRSSVPTSIGAMSFCACVGVGSRRPKRTPNERSTS